MREILLSGSEIAARVAVLGREIAAEYAGMDVTLIPLLNGGMVFGADLFRALSSAMGENGSVLLDTIAVSSYSGVSSTGSVTFRALPKNPVRGVHILLVDDILDTGRSLNAVIRHLQAEGAASVKTCVLFDKKTPRAEDGLAAADWYGFVLPERFVIGCGLDYNEKFRGLPDLIALD